MTARHTKGKAQKTVNSQVDYCLELTDIEGVESHWEQSHQVRALVINGKSPVLDQLAQWKTGENADYKKIMKVMERVARLDRVTDEKHVTADEAKRGVYEMRAHRGHARVLFFYDNDPRRTTICLVTYWKGKGDQHAAFDMAAGLMQMWQQAKPAEPRLAFPPEKKRK